MAPYMTADRDAGRRRVCRGSQHPPIDAPARASPLTLADADLYSIQPCRAGRFGGAHQDDESRADRARSRQEGPSSGPHQEDRPADRERCLRRDGRLLHQRARRPGRGEVHLSGFWHVREAAPAPARGEEPPDGRAHPDSFSLHDRLLTQRRVEVVDEPHQPSQDRRRRQVAARRKRRRAPPGVTQAPPGATIEGMLNPRLELCDLHIHVGGAVAPHILWSIAHDQGFKLPVSPNWEFRDLVTAAPDRVASLGDYLAMLHQWTEK